MLAATNGYGLTSSVRPAPRAARSGVTLLEIMFALGLLVVLALGFLYSAMSTVRLNRMTELEVAATNAIAAQLDSMIAASRDNESLAGGIANGMVFYLEKVHDATKGITGHPIRMNLNTTTGVLTYEFPIAEPGHVTGGITTADTRLRETQYELGVGVMEVYLKEEYIPAAFYAWNNLKRTGAVETVDPADNTYFDMNKDDKKTGDFTPLFLNARTSFGQADYLIDSLPITVTIRYYASKDALDNDKEDLKPGFKENSDGSVFSKSRNFILNHATAFAPAG